ncbi:MAG TPA: D-glycero-beta-D-manno-heptose 1-phosphate adenylyltransferase [Gemmatimonadales bacterium]|nr:D-glycero-beta-D-manno-heptose 1-phosphate adenylyltransferase [Gemmatimonadales bacterium]
MAGPVVFTNGVFDVLHAGHVALLEAARAAGAALVVGVNADASVRRLGKGADRPLVGEVDRTRVLAALACVDCVVLFEEDTPLELIHALRPDVLVKGADYGRDQIVGADDVEGWGGRVVRVPLVPGKSTTDLVRRLRGA